MVTWEAEIRAPRAKHAEPAPFVVVNDDQGEAHRIFSVVLGVPLDYVRMTRRHKGA